MITLNYKEIMMEIREFIIIINKFNKITQIIRI